MKLEASVVGCTIRSRGKVQGKGNLWWWWW